jgi:hypothetical protein
MNSSPKLLRKVSLSLCFVIGAALGISALEAIAADTPCSGRKGASLAVISSFAKTARSAWASHALSAQRMMGVSEAPELQTSITLYLDRENLQPLKH